METFRLQPEFFPQSTRDWLELEWILTAGMLPLGTKQGYRYGLVRATFANVGCLRPWDRVRLEEVQSRLPQEEVDGVRFYEVRPEPFWDVLQKNYQLDASKLKALSNQPLHPAIRSLLDTV